MESPSDATASRRIQGAVARCAVWEHRDGMMIARAGEDFIAAWIGLGVDQAP
jgi:hypothetical protein